MKKSKVSIYSVCALLTLCTLASCGSDGKGTSNSVTSSESSTASSKVTESSSTSNTSSEAPSVTGISLNKEEMTLNLDDHQEETLTVSFAPTGTTGDIVWDSSDPTVASVENGKVKALKAGSTTVTAKLLSNLSIKATCAVTVESNYVDYEFKAIDAEVTSGSKNLKENIVGFVGEDSSVNITYVIEAEKASNFDLGINISSNTQSYKLTDVFTIKLNNEKLTSNAYTKIGNCWGDYSEISVGSYQLNQGENTINIVFDKTITDWQTFNFSALELHAPQTLTFKNKKEPVRMTSLTLNKHEESVEFEANKTIALTATVLPANAIADIAWTSSNAAVAAVDSKGVVTIKGTGNATITATCNYDTTIKDSYVITVTTKQNVYTFNAADDKVKADKGTKNAKENCIGVDSTYNAQFTYTFNSDKAGEISLSAVVSGHNVARKFTDVYAMNINGVSKASDGIIPVGEMWTGYTTIALGTFSFAKGINTIEFTYLQSALTWQSYNFRSISITTYNTITLENPVEKQTLTVLANDTNVATNGSLDSEGAIGAKANDILTITNKINSSKAAKATLKAMLSASNDGRAISSIYGLTVNGVSVTPSGNFAVGAQWTSYSEYTLGQIDLVEGTNTIVFTYDYNSSGGGWTYNYKSMTLESEATLTLLNANQ